MSCKAATLTFRPVLSVRTPHRRRIRGQPLALPAAFAQGAPGLLAALRRRKLAAALAFVAITIPAALYIAQMPLLYEAEMRLFMTRSRVNTPVSPGGSSNRRPSFRPHRYRDEFGAGAVPEHRSARRSWPPVWSLASFERARQSEDGSCAQDDAAEPPISPVKKTSITVALFVARDACGYSASEIFGFINTLYVPFFACMILRVLVQYIPLVHGFRRLKRAYLGPRLVWLCFFSSISRCLRRARCASR